MLRRTFLLALALLATGPAFAMKIQQVTSAGGIHAWLVEDHASKVISLSFGFRCGAACDPADKRGLSLFAMSLLNEGAGSYDSGAYQGKLADLSAAVSFDVGDDWLTGGVETLAPTRDEVFELLRLALVEPRFDAPAVERIRAEIGQAIESQEQDPDELAGHVFMETEFPGLPYGAWLTGTAQDVAKLGAADFREFVTHRLGRDGLLVSVVGDISADELKPLLDKTFGGLPATTTEAVVPADVAAAAPGGVVLAKRPEPQSVVRFGQPGIAIRDKDYYVARVVDHVLGGGGFTARLEQEVREKRGLAYGITTQLVDRLHSDFILGEVGTQNGKVADTIDIVREQWAKMRDSGPTQSEVDNAKAYLNGSYTIGLNSSGAIAQRLQGLQEQGLGPDYFERRPALINAVTLDDAKRVAHALLDPSRLVFAVVGEPANLKPDKIVDPVN
jgi:zinc protease